jgi:hypothetical protein
MDIQEPVVVYTLTDPLKAEIIKNDLLSEGIACRLDGLNFGAALPLSPLADIQVVVHAGDADRARRLIHQHEHETQKEEE